MYLLKTRLYVVAAGALDGTLKEADALKFLDSFKITDADSTPPKPVSTSDWKDYKPKNGAFTAVFPPGNVIENAVKLPHQTYGYLNLNYASLTSKSGRVMVGYIDLPGKSLKPDDVLKLGKEFLGSRAG